MNEPADNPIYHLHLVSDATGETINAVARACLVQFDGKIAKQHHWNLVRSKRQLDLVFEGLRQWPGLILYTFVDEELRRILEEFCKNRHLKAVSVLDPALGALAGYFGISAAQDPGRQHELNAEYFARIEAMDFALALDDGQNTHRLEEADILILGVSRTSKTPTSVYLANRGLRVANIPLVKDIDLPVDLTTLKKPLIVGLTKDPESLAEIRASRLKLLHEERESSYADPDQVKEEVIAARRLFARLECSVIDVSHRSIEETAAEILMLLNQRQLKAAAS
jgi:[pyruvate, water dikinase]-phosphate phosphotransferase / [pyruvate, water dikinase] kinase